MKHLPKTYQQIRTYQVYESAAGDLRLVIHVSSGDFPIVTWRTANPDLSKGVPAQGAESLASFRGWAIRQRPAQRVDIEAYDVVQRGRLHRRKDRRIIVRMRKAQGAWPPETWPYERRQAAIERIRKNSPQT